MPGSLLILTVDRRACMDGTQVFGASGLALQVRVSDDTAVVQAQKTSVHLQLYMYLFVNYIFRRANRATRLLEIDVGVTSLTT